MTLPRITSNLTNQIIVIKRHVSRVLNSTRVANNCIVVVCDGGGVVVGGNTSPALDKCVSWVVGNTRTPGPVTSVVMTGASGLCHATTSIRTVILAPTLIVVLKLRTIRGVLNSFCVAGNYIVVVCNGGVVWVVALGVLFG
jgi:hypothetical protein